MTALAVEVNIALGLSASDLLQLQWRLETWRAEYDRALAQEHAARSCHEARGPVAECYRCIHAEGGLSHLLCGRHTASFDRLCAATRQRITAQRGLADAAWALQRARP